MVLVKDVMSTKVSYLNGDRTVREAAELMARADVGSVLVYIVGEPIGIVTERDIVRKIVAEGFDCSKVRIADIMSSPIISIPPDATVEQASELMSTYKIRRLPVIQEGKVVGIIAANDIAAHCAREKNYEDVRLNAIARIPKGELPPPYG